MEVQGLSIEEAESHCVNCVSFQTEMGVCLHNNGQVLKKHAGGAKDACAHKTHNSEVVVLVKSNASWLSNCTLNSREIDSSLPSSR